MTDATVQLIPHPVSHGEAAAKIAVHLTRGGPRALRLRYVVEGDIDRLYVPAPDQPSRTDELWKRTCFEVFLRGEAGERYYEYNLAPSTRWAAYRFNGYRNEMADADVTTPAITTSVIDGRFELTADLDLAGLPHLPDDAAWRVALSAVIEDVEGQRAFWALTHPSAEPDFHNRASFALTLPAAGASA